MPRFPRRRIRECLRNSRRAATSQERGRALEELVCLLFSSVPGTVPPIRNQIDFAEGGEIDVFVANNPSKNGLWFLPIALLAECKNWQERVGSAEIRVLEDRLRERSCRCGILL